MPSDPSSQQENARTSFTRKDWAFAALLLVATLAAYYPAWFGKPVWDDDAHLTAPGLRSIGGLYKIWFVPGATQQYYPLVHSAFWVQSKVWGYAPAGYHFVNIVLHVFCAVMLARILRFLAVPGAWLAAAIFALHPIEVESVAWITELKNTLSGAFYLGAALAYLRFDRDRKPRLYWIALALFVLGLFCKTVIATLPAALLVVFWWKRGRLSWKRDAEPLIPFFVMGIAMGLVTARVEKDQIIGGEAASFSLMPAERFLVAGRAFWFYIGKLLWPADLAFMYPRWHVSQGVGWQYLFPLVAVAFVAVLWVLRSRSRSPLAAVLFYGGTLFPALGFIDAYPFLFSYVADHFQYLAGAGIITLVAAGGVMLHDRLQGAQKHFAQAAAVAILAVLAALTWRQCRMYADAHTLYTKALEKNPGWWTAWNNLGNELLAQGKTDEAMDYFNKVLALRPGDANAENNLGQSYFQKGDVAQAVVHFEKALLAHPDKPLPVANVNLGNILLRQGHVDEAMAHYQAALKIQSRNPNAHNGLGNVYYHQGNLDGALAEYQSALETDPDSATIHNNIGNILLQKEDVSGAFAEYEKSIRLQPEYVEALNNLAWLLATSPTREMRNGARAVELAEKADRLAGNRAGILGTLAAAYAEAGRYPQAVAAAEQARRLAVAHNDTAQVTVLDQELKFYRAGKPFHQ